MEQSAGISVIIPFYNAERYLNKSITSVMEQVDSSFELILVDDGSTDDCRRICDGYIKDDERIRYFHKENGGAGSARNLGISKARGKYILFLDSDDYLISGRALSELYEKAEKDRLDLLFFGGEASNDITGEKAKCPHYLNSENLDVIESGLENMRKAASCKEYNTHVCMYLIRSEYLRKTGVGFDEKMWALEDEEFTFLLRLYADRTENIKDVLYHRRYRSGSIMTSLDNRKRTESLIHLINKLVSHETELDDAKAKQQLYLKINGHLQQLRDAYAYADAGGRMHIKKAIETELKLTETCCDNLVFMNKILMKNIGLSSCVLKARRELRKAIRREHI